MSAGPQRRLQSEQSLYLSPNSHSTLHLSLSLSMLGGSVDSMPEAGGVRRPLHSETSSSIAPSNGGNVDTVLFKNLVEMVPLVESLMDRKAKSSFTRRASMIYTPAPSQLRKVTDPNGRITYNSAKKRKDTGDNVNLESAADVTSLFSSRVAGRNIQKNKEELTMLREQADDLQKKLFEKDAALKSAENSLNQMNAARSSDDLRNQVAEKDLLLKSTNLQLYDTKIKLADKQAALEKLEWEVRMSNRKVEELHGRVVSMEVGLTTLMQLFEEISKTGSDAYSYVNIDSPYQFEKLPPIDGIDETEMEKMEEARTSYVSAVATAKENPCDESIAAAAEARLRLQAFVF